ncbi:ribokinase, partial [Corallococcus exiguus]|nr:ribokinase [Corallococcus exiguus]
MARPIKIATLGNAFLDRVLSVSALPTGAGKMRVLRQVESGGGIAATAACTAARFNASSLCYSRLGSDAAGNEIIRRLEFFGVRTDGILRVDQGRSAQ